MLYKKTNLTRCVLLMLVLILVLPICACSNFTDYFKGDSEDMDKFDLNKPYKVDIEGYDGNVMEPFISRDGKYLFFNNLNDSVDTCLHWAEKIDSVKFQYKGKLEGVNGTPPHLDAVASMDSKKNFYFISTRDYPVSYESVFTGVFEKGVIKELKPVAGDFYIRKPGCIVMDIEISPDGKSLYVSNAEFASGNPLPNKSDINIAVKKDKEFLLVENSAEIMKNINTESALEYAPSISNDGLALFFTRLDPASLPTKMYVSKRSNVNEPFEKPVQINEPGFAEAITVTFDGKIIYYHKMDTVYSLYMMRIR